jgi:hypothetical protein
MGEQQGISAPFARACFLCVCVLGATATVPGTTVGAALPSHTEQATTVTAAFQTSFGSRVETVTGFKPFYVTGDFNGDGAQDVIAVIRLTASRRTLPPDVRVLNPFEPPRRRHYPTPPASVPMLALAILHSWKAPQPAAKFLLIGEAPILILDDDRTRSGPNDAKNLMSLLRRRAQRRPGAQGPPAAKGDMIMLGSQVGDSVLYWNGQTYRWEDSPED